APFVEHGEILVGRKIRVWRDKDEIYRPAVMKSFDVKYNMHKVLSDDGFEAVIDLKLKQWMFDNLSAMPDSSVCISPSPFRLDGMEANSPSNCDFKVILFTIQQNETQESSKQKGVTILSSQNNENERLEDENLERSKEKQVSIVSSEEALFSNVREVEDQRLERFL
ncbi:hypothetical protein Tco_1163778, partial [Tanacetum coccineum]